MLYSEMDQLSEKYTLAQFLTHYEKYPLTEHKKLTNSCADAFQRLMQALKLANENETHALLYDFDIRILFGIEPIYWNFDIVTSKNAVIYFENICHDADIGQTKFEISLTYLLNQNEKINLHKLNDGLAIIPTISDGYYLYFQKGTVLQEKHFPILSAEYYQLRKNDYQAFEKMLDVVFTDNIEESPDKDDKKTQHSYQKTKFSNCVIIRNDNEFYADTGLIIKHSNYIKGMVNSMFKESTEPVIRVDVSHLVHVTNKTILAYLDYIYRVTDTMEIEGNKDSFKGVGFFGLYEIADFLQSPSILNVVQKYIDITHEVMPRSIENMQFMCTYQIKGYLSYLQRCLPIISHIKLHTNESMIDGLIRIFGKNLANKLIEMAFNTAQ